MSDKEKEDMQQVPPPEEPGEKEVHIKEGGVPPELPEVEKGVEVPELPEVENK